jgi:hypothetical protein
MYGLVADKEKPFKVDIDGGLDEKIERAFDDHGTNKKTGTSRLFEWFVSLPPEWRGMILSRDTGRLRVLIAFDTLLRAGKLPKEYERTIGAAIKANNGAGEGSPPAHGEGQASGRNKPPDRSK